MESNKTSESLPMTGSEQAKYVYSGRVMLTSVILLFLVCFIIVCFHTYARWFLSRRSRRQNGGAATSAAAADIEKAAKKGLSPTQLKSLPVFIYASSPTSSPKSPAPECAVCLSEFQETEPVRLLPSCKHCFHLECIDMWFYSHSNCPLCRAPAVPAVPCSPLPENLIPADVCDNGSIRPVPDSSGSRVLCPGSETGCSSSLPARLRGGDRSKLPELLAVVVEIPLTNDGGNRLQ